MTHNDITVGTVYTNGRGRFRLVTKITSMAGWKDAHYAGAYLNTQGKMKPTINGINRCSPHSLASWATRVATDAEAQAVRAVLAKEPA